MPCLQLGQAQRPVTRDHRETRALVTRKIKQLGETGRAREAVSELAQMARIGECTGRQALYRAQGVGSRASPAGVQPDTQAGTALLHACVRSGKIDMAQSVFNELFGAPLG